MTEIIHEGITYRVYDHLYAVSKCGKVLRKFAPYTPIVDSRGYATVGRRRTLHRMVAICWIGKPSKNHHVHHINSNKTDNHVDNLEWVTPKTHFADRHKDTVGKHKVSEEQKQKLRELRTGSKHSEETKEKMRESQLRIGNRPPSWSGKKHKPETKEKMSASNNMSRACIVFGITYRSFAEAGRALDERPLSLRKRCFSKNFPDYQLL